MLSLKQKIISIDQLTLREASWLIFAVVFLFCALAAALVQFVLLPYVFPGLQAMQGVMVGIDSETFHADAMQQYRLVKELGWQAWRIRPNTVGIAGLVSLVYLLFGPHFFALIPINAVVHALSAVIIFRLLRQYMRIANVPAILGLVPFVASPTAALWYTQIHKDGISILAMLAYLYFFTQLWSNPPNKRFAFNVLMLCVSLFFLWWMRHYMLIVFAALSVLFIALLSCVKVFNIITKGSRWYDQRTGKLLLAATVTFVFAFSFQTTVDGIRPPPPDIDPSVAAATPSAGASMSADGLKPTAPTPSSLSNITDFLIRFKTYMSGFEFNPVPFFYKVRRGFATTSKGTTEIDADILPATALEMLLYLPKGIFNAFFAPFPHQLVTSGMDSQRTILKKFVLIEMLISYLIFPGVCAIAFRKPKSSEEYYILCFCMFFMALYGFLFTNGGTLSRMRFGVRGVLYAYGLALIVMGVSAAYRWGSKRWRAG